MARLTLARKIATIVLIVWKRGVSFDAQYLKSQSSLSVSDRVRSISGYFLWRWLSGPRDTLVRERVSADKLGPCVLRAPSLTHDSRPSRTTRKSYGPRVPDRTMVATFDRVLLCWFRNGQASSRKSDENRR